MSEESEPLYEKLIYENEAKSYQLKLVVNQYKDTYYVHIRKYFLSYESDWVPSKEGISMEASFENILSLLDGLIEIVSKEEARSTILKHFKDILDESMHTQ